ncbi:MAG: DNA-binding protein WhiA [Chloroflexota bacterium]
MGPFLLRLADVWSLYLHVLERTGALARLSSLSLPLEPSLRPFWALVLAGTAVFLLYSALACGDDMRVRSFRAVTLLAGATLPLAALRVQDGPWRIPLGGGILPLLLAAGLVHRSLAAARRSGAAERWILRTRWGVELAGLALFSVAAGLFLSRGSLSLSASRAHLEFVVPADAAPALAARLDEIGLPAASRLRRGRGVVTWKSGETIGTFFRLIGAGGSLLELEARQVARALRGELNRVINAESANLQRAVAASSRQVTAIERLELDGRYDELPHVTRLVADARRAEPEATLSELAERLGIHRSAVQRALERVESLALHDDQGVGRHVAGPRVRRSRTAVRVAPPA